MPGRMRRTKKTDVLISVDVLDRIANSMPMDTAMILVHSLYRMGKLANEAGYAKSGYSLGCEVRKSINSVMEKLKEDDFGYPNAENDSTDTINLKSQLRYSVEMMMKKEADRIAENTIAFYTTAAKNAENAKKKNSEDSEDSKEQNLKTIANAIKKGCTNVDREY